MPDDGSPPFTIGAEPAVDWNGLDVDAATDSREELYGHSLGASNCSCRL
jgi:hypothetical protein